MNTSHAPGVYFGMDADEYHADPSLSSSGIRDMIVSPLEYWRNSPFNARRVNESTGATENGTATHLRLLEGKEKFDAAYYPELRQSDYPDAIAGGDALAQRCGELGLKKSGTIAERCIRIREADPSVQLWPVLVEEHAARHGGKAALSREDWDRIETTAAEVADHPDAAKALTGGCSEVSIFWREGDVPMKARIDHLKLRAVVDLKTFANARGKPVAKAVSDAIAYGRYDIQATLYPRAVDALIAMLANGTAHVEGDHDPAFLAQLASPTFVFVFIESCDYPSIVVRSFQRAASGGPTLYWSRANTAIDGAIETWRRCMAKYGPDRPWTEHEKMTALTDEEMPLWLDA